MACSWLMWHCIELIEVHGRTPDLELRFLSLGRLVDERFVDMRDDTSTGNGGLDEGVQFFVSPDG